MPVQLKAMVGLVLVLGVVWMYGVWIMRRQSGESTSLTRRSYARSLSTRIEEKH